MNSERIYQQRVIFPCHLNDNNTLFGGIAMQWMDEVAYIAAANYSQQKLVTVCVEKIKFLLPIHLGAMVEVTGWVASAGRVKLEVRVEVSIINREHSCKQKAIEGVFTMAAVNESSKPVVLVPTLK